MYLMFAYFRNHLLILESINGFAIISNKLFNIVFHGMCGERLKLKKKILKRGFAAEF